jgi:hypothetical protein
MSRQVNRMKIEEIREQLPNNPLSHTATASEATISLGALDSSIHTRGGYIEVE